MFETGGHQRLDVRGQETRRGRGRIGPEFAQDVFLGLVGIGLVLGVLVFAPGDDLVDLTKIRRAALDRQQTGRNEDRLAGLGKGVERLVVLVEEEVCQDRDLGEALREARRLGDPGKRVVAMRGIGPVEGAEPIDLVAV